MKRIYFTVTNDLNYDQRMHRICKSLCNAGFDVVLVGRRLPQSLPLANSGFHKRRLPCFFKKGPLFYAEYNLRLFFFLLFRRMDGVCAIDLDTILPCLLISQLKRIPRIYDAHEFFTEMKEVRSRPPIQRAWRRIERWAVPRFANGYTVSKSLAQEFLWRYGVDYRVIRNLPVLRPLAGVEKKERFLLAQGAVNEGRAFEYLMPAMKEVPYKLVICGDGNFMQQLKELIHFHGVSDRVDIRGMLLPEDLWPVTCSATLGLGLADREGAHQFLALPNKFFDYIHAGLPQIAMAYPEYEYINQEFRVAVLLDTLDPVDIARAINSLMENETLLEELRQNCLRAREVYSWQKEEKTLIDFYKTIFRIG